ncbi:hypothetical protein BsWGS_20790 [Bradybaena similaris]
MEHAKVRELELEVQEINRVENEGENLDTVDGFEKFMKKQLHKICRLPVKYDRNTVGASCIDGTKRSKVEGEGDADFGDIYDFTHAERGLAIIINNEDFPETSYFNRLGSLIDAMALYQTFKNLGFRVWVTKNLKSWQMAHVLRLGSKEYDHRNADCFACAILSHGEETIVNAEHGRLVVRKDLLIGADGKNMAIDTVTEMFNDIACPGLRGKPRLFFIQACRGKKYDDGWKVAVTGRKQETSGGGRQSCDGTHQDNIQNTSSRPHETSSSSSSERHRVPTDETDAEPCSSEESSDEELPPVNLQASSSATMGMPNVSMAPVRVVSLPPLYKDSLIMYATPPGHSAWRTTDTGSWFVKSLCSALDVPAIFDRSLLSALTNVVGIVARDLETFLPCKPAMHRKKQTPVFESMLVNDVFFTPK